MFITNLQLPSNQWTEIDLVNTGDTFLIQNLTADDIRFIVLDSEPTNTNYGCKLAPGQQLVFKKVAGDLYMRGKGQGVIAIEQQEE